MSDRITRPYEGQVVQGHVVEPITGVPQVDAALSQVGRRLERTARRAGLVILVAAGVGLTLVILSVLASILLSHAVGWLVAVALVAFGWLLLVGILLLVGFRRLRSL